jgi:uncharacterized paraquat-inducible protein A
MVEALVENFYHPDAEIKRAARKGWEKYLRKKDRTYLEAMIIESGIDIQEFARVRKEKMTEERKKVKEEECYQTYYKCMFCHAINSDFDGLDCPECENEGCIETIQMTEKQLENLNP